MGVETRLAEKLRHAEKTPVTFLRAGQPLELPPFERRKRFHVVIKARHCDASPGVAQLREQLAERHRRILDRAAEEARVQIAGRSAQGEFEGDDAPQRVGERRQVLGGHAGVGHHHGIAAKFPAAGPQERRQVAAANLLLALEHERQIAGQGGAGPEIGFDRLEMGEMLALVVGGAAGDQRAPADGRFEGRRLPEFERLRRLHVVVAVNQEMRAPPRPAGRAGEHDRMARRRTQFGLEADLPAMLREPGGAGAEVPLVLRLRGNAGEAEEFAQLANEAGLVGFEIMQDGVHGNFRHVLRFQGRWQNE